MLYENPMTKEQYTSYLKSEWWKSKRDERFGFDKGVCQRCGMDGEVVHHRTYENVWGEKIEDLVTLCKDCHKKLHVLAKKINYKTYFEIDEELYVKTGKIVPKGDILSIADICNVTRESPDEEISYRNPVRVCKILDIEMEGAGRLLLRLLSKVDDSFEFNKRRLSSVLKECGLSAHSANELLGFLQSKKFIVRHDSNKKIMVNPYLTSDRDNEVRTLCLYNKFCDFLEGKEATE